MKKLCLFLLLPLLLVTSVSAYATAPITGVLTTCVGTQTALTDATPLGIWTSSNVSIATVGLLSGVVTGVSVGTATISYNVSGVNATVVVTVGTPPVFATIAGPSVVCVNSSISLTDPIPGGVWSVAAGSPAVVDGAGNVTGTGAGGVATISYAITGSICTASATQTVTVNPTPYPGFITGVSPFCPGFALPLSDATSGGVWSSSATGVASVSATGLVSGIAPGLTNISYAVSNSFGCTGTATTLVEVGPAAVTGNMTICAGNITDLADASAGGTWSSGNTAIAHVGGSTGVVAGVSAGTVNISYTLPEGCFTTAAITVQPALSPIIGPSSMCGGTLVAFGDASGGGTWTSGDPSVLTVGASSGIVEAVSSGDTYITYTLSPGCIGVFLVSVNPTPSNFNVTGGGSYCAGGTGVSIGLSGSEAGISYKLYFGSVLESTLPGNGGALDFGSYTAGGTYNVLATDTASGCFHYMTGVATVTVVPVVSPFVTVSPSTGTSLCAGTAVLFTALPINGGATPIYQWQVNGVDVGTTASTFIYTPINLDEISVKMLSDANCVVPDSASNFVIMNVSDIWLPGINITATPGDSVCAGTPVTFIASFDSAGTAPTLKWMKNGISAGTGLTYTYDPTNGDNIFCELQSSYVCPFIDSIASNNIVMQVTPVYMPEVVVTASPSNRISLGDTVTFTAAVTFGGISYSYQWEVNGAPIPGANTNTYITSLLHNHDVVSCAVNGISACGSAIGTGNIEIIDTTALGISYLYTGAPDVTLVPNPNKGTFTIKGTLGSQVDEAATVTVSDLLGQVVYKRQVMAYGGKLNAQVQVSLPDGLYLLNVQSETGSTVIRFVMEQ